MIEADLFRDHRLALGGELRIKTFADRDDGGAGLLRGLRPVDLSAGLDDFGLIAFEIEIEMAEDMVLDVARLIAQRIEFRQIGPGLGALLNEARPGLGHRPLQLAVGDRPLHIGGKF